MIQFVPACLAGTFVLAVAFAPAAALAQSGSDRVASTHHRAARHGVHRPPIGAEQAVGAQTEVAPAFGSPVREDQNLPAISRNPDDCVKTMCTCLGGGGC